MAYTINVTNDRNPVLLTYFDDINFDELIQSRLETLEVIKNNGKATVLVDVRKITNKISTLDHFKFASSHANILPFEVKIALLIREDLYWKSKFSETVATNRGIRMMVFTDEKNALKWLTEF